MSDNGDTERLINIDEALALTGGDHSMLIDIAELFLTEGPDQLSAIQASINQSCASEIRKTAHTLKGSVVIFGATQVADAARMIETAARDDDLSEVPVAWDALQSSMARLVEEVKELCSHQ